jgi:hypothetical protein
MFVVFYVLRNYIFPDSLTFNVALNDIIFQVSIPKDLFAGFLAVGVRLAIKGIIEDIFDILLPIQKIPNTLAMMSGENNGSGSASGSGSGEPSSGGRKKPGIG